MEHFCIEVSVTSLAKERESVCGDKSCPCWPISFLCVITILSPTIDANVLGALAINVNSCKGWDKTIRLEIVEYLQICWLSERCPWTLEFPKIPFWKLDVSGNFTPHPNVPASDGGKVQIVVPLPQGLGIHFWPETATVSGWIWNVTATALWWASFLSLF